MSDPQQQAEISRQSEGDGGLFSGPKAEPSNRGLLFAVAGAILLFAIGVGAMLIRAKQDTSQALNKQLSPDPYASNLVLTQMAMSQSTSLSGSTSTFLDGHIRNSGGDLITGVTVQVVFRNDVGLTPRVDTLPLFLIRTHEPYVDTEPVSAAPLKPGEEAEFRLIFETMPTNWNQQMPEVTVVRVAKK